MMMTMMMMMRTNLGQLGTWCWVGVEYDDDGDEEVDDYDDDDEDEVDDYDDDKDEVRSTGDVMLGHSRLPHLPASALHTNTMYGGDDHDDDYHCNDDVDDDADDDDNDDLLVQGLHARPVRRSNKGRVQEFKN